MRRYLIAAAAAGGLLLLGSPAQAEDQTPAAGQGGLLGGVMDPAGGVLNPDGGVRVASPLDDSPIVSVKPGTNTVPTDSVLPAEKGKPRTGLGSARQAGAAQTARRPAATGGLPVLGGGGLPVAGGGLPVAGGGLPVAGGGGLPALGGLPVVGGLLPNGGDGLPVGGGLPVGRAGGTESGLLGSDLPLLGGLLPDEPAHTLPADADDPADASDVSGLPPGGTDVPPGTTPGTTPDDTPSTKPIKPATKPGDDRAPSAAGPGDDRKRLHEEPIDDEASTDRKFSDGRPVAGVDPDYR
ncbi:hypothetical protein AB0M20_38255 [Actinoplanes sp. NPDC051633]|uniref:hypothetical protein n=1 Tax=Actinoplanes sp. NPDC051633 TaxID=3155670 RepID=UPI00342072C3